MPRAFALVVLLASARTYAEPTAADVASAPLPGEESGRTDPVDDGDTPAREVARAALFVPRWGIELALTPAHEALWAWDRYEVDERGGEAAASGSMHLGFSASLGYESGFGIDGVIGGGRLTAHNFGGEHEDASLQAIAGAGYYFSQLYAAQVTTGQRFGDRFELALDGGYEVRPRDGFWGTGNMSGQLARYEQDRSRIAVSGDVRLVSDLHLRPEVAVAQHAFGDDVPAGWMDTSLATGALAVRWDSRHPAGEWDSHRSVTGGTFASVFAARSHVLAGGDDFWRYGLDVEQLIRIGVGPRVLALRVHGEAVSGDAVPVVELPALGGPLLLRGYALDRFRDRAAAVATVEYRWDLAKWIGAHAFVDAGRVYDSVEDLTASGMRAGYGIGIDIGHESGRIDLASSVDGGLYLAATLNPVRDLDQRARER